MVVNIMPLIQSPSGLVAKETLALSVGIMRREAKDKKAGGERRIEDIFEMFENV